MQQRPTNNNQSTRLNARGSICITYVRMAARYREPKRRQANERQAIMEARACCG